MAISEKGAGRSYTNCSDGAFLNKAVAKFAKSVSLPEQANKNFKADFVKSTFEASPVMDQEAFAKLWNIDTITDATDTCFEKLRDIINNAAFLIDKKYLIEINKLMFFGKTNIDRGIATWIRGSLHMMLLSAEFFGNRVVGTEAELAFEEIMREELLRALDDMHKRSIVLLEKLS